MKVIFAIGNPGAQYAKTRHNVGIHFAEWLLKKKSTTGSTGTNSKYIQYALQGNKTLLCISKVYMNESGKAISAFWKKNSSLTPQDFLIVQDDLEHRLRYARVKEGGSPE